jgi:pimeloyl-ACP methyl ester carboxylesterase
MTYVFIPGAGGAAYYWHRVETELHALGHETVAADLPADDDTAGLDAYADAVVEAACPRKAPVVLVAQSLGAFTVPRVCERLPVSRIVLLNAMIPAPGETAGAWWEAAGHDAAIREMDAREGRPADGSFDDELHFLHDVPEDIVRVLGERARRQSGAPFADGIETWPDLPTHVIVGRDDRFFPADFQRRLARERLGVEPDEVPGGHLAALVSPAEVTRLLVSYG